MDEFCPAPVIDPKKVLEVPVILPPAQIKVDADPLLFTVLIKWERPVVVETIFPLTPTNTFPVAWIVNGNVLGLRKLRFLPTPTYVLLLPFALRLPGSTKCPITIERELPTAVDEEFCMFRSLPAKIFTSPVKFNGLVVLDPIKHRTALVPAPAPVAINKFTSLPATTLISLFTEFNGATFVK